MNATAAQIPPDPTDVEPEDAASADRPPRRKVAARRREGRRVWLLGLLASAVLHALLFFAATRIGLVPVGGPSTDEVRPSAEPRVDDLQVVQLVETPDAVAETPEPAAPVQPEADEPEPVEEAPAEPVEPTEPAAEAEEEAARVPRSPAERLQPRMGDPRLWALPSELAAPALSDMERARARIYAELESMNDSMLTALAAEANARDWTVEGEDGQRWGISEGDGYFPAELHLGDVTIPLPFSFPLPAEAQARIGEWSAIRRQAAQAQINEWIQERIEAIRERRERERNQEDGQTGL